MNTALMLLKENALIVGLLLAVWGSWKVAGWKSAVDASLQLQAQNIDRLGKNIQDLTNTVSRLEARIDALCEKVDGLTNGLSRLEARVDALCEKVDGLTNSFSRLDTKVTVLSEKVDGLQHIVHGHS